MTQYGKPARQAIARRAPDVPRCRRRDSGNPSLSASCNNGQPVASNDSTSANELTDTFSVGVKQTASTLSSWSKNKISAEGQASGLCETSISVENLDEQGFDVIIEYKNPGPPITLTAPNATVTTTWTETIHYKTPPCDIGTWQGTDTDGLVMGAGNSTVYFSDWVGGGPMTLEINAAGNASLTTSEVLHGTVTAPMYLFELGYEEETFPSTLERTVKASGTAGLDFSHTPTGIVLAV